VKTLFIWEGATYYLSGLAVDRTLAFVAQNSAPGSSIIFDYTYTSVVEGVRKRNEVSSMRRYERFTGEAIHFGIPEGQVQAFLQARGFEHVKDATS
jgi:methyltransferase (TIGR00027 family)